MHKRRVNELKLHFIIEPAGPILIKSGADSGLDPTLPTMSFVRTQHPFSGQRTIYLPGSSLKGVIRSHSERIIRTVLGDDPHICCDPLARRGNCQSRIKDKKIKDTAAQYKELCLACRIFGHMDQASHFLTADAYPETSINELPVRHNVAIDRLSGGVAVGPFDMEVALTGAFHSTLFLYNFELWQVGLIALALRDIAEGRVRLGFAKSRGLGEVKLSLAQLDIGYPGQFGGLGHAFDREMVGVSSLLQKDGRQDTDFITDYGYVPGEDKLTYPVTGVYDDGDMWGRPSIRFGATEPMPAEGAALQAANEEITAVLGQAVPAWAAYAQQRQGGR